MSYEITVDNNNQRAIYEFSNHSIFRGIEQLLKHQCDAVCFNADAVQNMDTERTTGQLYKACIKAEHKVKELEQDIARLRAANEQLVRANTDLCNEVDKLRDENNELKTREKRLYGEIAYLRGPDYAPAQCQVLRAKIVELERQLDDLRYVELTGARVQERVVYVPYQTNPYPAPWQTPDVVTCSTTAGTKDCSTSEYSSDNAKMKA